MKINIEISKACASTGWCFGLGMIHQWLVGNFPRACQDEVWGDDPGTIVCGSYAPAGTCEVVDGGYRVAGSWSYASNVDNSSWALIGVFFPPATDDGPPLPGFLLVPESDYTVHDDWHVTGLVATGSKDVVCQDVFVPEHRRVSFAELSSGNSPGSAPTAPDLPHPLAGRAADLDMHTGDRCARWRD